MAGMSIGEVARRAQLRPSAIRYSAGITQPCAQK